MRKSLFVGVLGTLLLAVLLFPFLKSDASYAPDQRNVFRVAPGGSPGSLPNFDIRLQGKGEFTDFDLNTTDGAQSAAKSAATQSRVSAVDQFRSNLKPEDSGNIRATVNETGAMKNFFIEGATLSAPQSDTADNIARRFLKQNASLFALSGRDVSDLEMIGEDNDRGTTFLKYVQTMGGIKVFEGEVQVVVNKNGEVLSVREGFLVSGQTVTLRPTVRETEAIAKAFGYAGKAVDTSLVETYTRASKGERSQFANPVSTDNEDVLSELNVLRIGDSRRTAPASQSLPGCCSGHGLHRESSSGRSAVGLLCW